MRSDFYTKIILTIIALALTGHLVLTLLSPGPSQAESEPRFAHVQVFTNLDGFFDAQTGDLWFYDFRVGDFTTRYRVTKLGQDLQITRRSQ